MIRFRGLAVGVALVAAALPAATAQAADRYTIQATASKVQAIGPFSPSADASPTAAIVAFGQPSSRKKLGETSCRIGWKNVGLRITFADFGGGDDPCGRDGKAQIVSAFGRVWNTGKGLRIGSTTKQLRKLYPSAKRRGSTYSLLRGPSVEGGSLDRVSAGTSKGRVRSFRIFVGAAGT